MYSYLASVLCGNVGDLDVVSLVEDGGLAPAGCAVADASKAAVTAKLASMLVKEKECEEE